MKGSGDGSDTAELTADDMQVVGETSRGEPVVAGRMPAQRATADANMGETQTRTDFGADATRKVSDPAKTPDDVAQQTLEQPNPEADGPEMYMRNPHTDTFEQVEGTATADIERMQAEMAELARISQITNAEWRDEQAVRDMHERRVRECRREVVSESLARTESRSLPWWSLAEDTQERLVERYGKQRAVEMCEQSRPMGNRRWRRSVPVSEFPEAVWAHLDDVYQEEAGFSVEAAVTTETVASTAHLEDGEVTGSIAVEREVLERVPRRVVREAWTRYYLEEYGDEAESAYETRLEVLWERVGYRVRPQAPKRQVVADIARELADGANVLRATNRALNKWFPNGVRQISDIDPTWPAASTRAVVTKVFEETHPSMRMAFIVADPQSGEEAKVTVWEQSAIAKASTRFPGQSSFEADGNGDKSGVLDHPEEGQWVLLENVKPGWYGGQLTLAVASDSVLTPLGMVEAYDPSGDDSSEASSGSESAPAADGAPSAGQAGGPSASASTGDDGEAAAVAAVTTGGMTAADDDQDGEDGDGAADAADEAGADGEMSAYAEQVYHYAMAMRAKVDDYEALHEAVETCPPPSREAIEAEAESDATDADVRDAIATVEGQAVVSEETEGVDETVPETVAAHSDGLASGPAPDEARYAFDREPPQVGEADD